MVQRIVTHREQVEMLAPWRVGMAYHVAEPGDPVHRIPAAEAHSYVQNNPNKVLNEIGDEEHSIHDLRDSIAKNGVQTPVEILTDGDRAFLSDGNHRAQIAHELGVPDIPAYVSHMAPEDYDFYASQSPIGWDLHEEPTHKHPAVGPALGNILDSNPNPGDPRGIVGSFAPWRVAHNTEDA